MSRPGTYSAKRQILSNTLCTSTASAMNGTHRDNRHLRYLEAGARRDDSEATAPPVFTPANSLGVSTLRRRRFHLSPLTQRTLFSLHRQGLLDSSGTASVRATLQADISVHRRRDGSNSKAVPIVRHVKTTKNSIKIVQAKEHI